MEPLDPAMFESDDMLPVLAERDIGALYRALRDAGVSQRQIAKRTRQSQSEVADVISGRRRLVDSYGLLVRIAEGLGVPRGLMGLAYCTCAYRGRGTIAEPEGAEDMLRRHLLGRGGVTLVSATVPGLGALLGELPGPGPVALPSQLSGAHVARVRDLIRRLGVGDVYCAPDVISGAAESAVRLLTVPGPDPVRRALQVAVAELHNEAGWAAYDAGLCHRALYHFARSLELATQAGDTYLQTLALAYAGLVCAEHGHPDDGLKMLQCAQVKAWDIPPDDQRAVVVGEVGAAAVEATALVDSAAALARMGRFDAALTHLAKGRDLWTPTRTDPFGDMDRPAALLELERERLDVAEALAAASVRRWEGGRLISRTRTRIVLAAIHVKAGESDGPRLAHDAITAVGKLSSVRVRQQLAPLAEALESRRGGDYADLARTARQVAATRV